MTTTPYPINPLIFQGFNSAPSAIQKYDSHLANLATVCDNLALSLFIFLCYSRAVFFNHNQTLSQNFASASPRSTHQLASTMRYLDDVEGRRKAANYWFDTQNDLHPEFKKRIAEQINMPLK